MAPYVDWELVFNISNIALYKLFTSFLCLTLSRHPRHVPTNWAMHPNSPPPIRSPAPMYRIITRQISEETRARYYLANTSAGTAELPLVKGIKTNGISSVELFSFERFPNLNVFVFNFHGKYIYYYIRGWFSCCHN